MTPTETEGRSPPTHPLGDRNIPSSHPLSPPVGPSSLSCSLPPSTLRPPCKPPSPLCLLLRGTPVLPPTSGRRRRTVGPDVGESSQVGGSGFTYGPSPRGPLATSSPQGNTSRVSTPILPQRRRGSAPTRPQPTGFYYWSTPRVVRVCFSPAPTHFRDPGWGDRDRRRYHPDSVSTDRSGTYQDKGFGVRLWGSVR